MNNLRQSGQAPLEWQTRFLSPSLLIGLATNALGFAAGAIFFTSAYGARFRGMEPEVKTFITLGLLATAAGLFAGIPASIYDMFRKRWVCGLIGFVLAFTPFFVANFVSDLAAYMMNLTWD